MDFKKYQKNDIANILKHNLRRFSDGKSSSNDSIIPDLTHQNYSLIDRGNSVADAKKYFAQLEKEIFHYKRSNVVHAIEWIVTMPHDCPVEKERAFFKTSYRYFADSLPMGERCIICAEVHKDEKFTNDKTGEVVSKPAHMHLMYVPAVRISGSEKIRIKDREVKRQLKKEVKQQITTPQLRRSLKKTGMTQDEIDQAVTNLTSEIRNKISSKIHIPDFKLCADSLTKRSQLLKVHPGLQTALNTAGIQATVYKQKKPGTSYIHLSGKQLKQITKATGIVIDHSLTAEELSQIINSVVVKEEKIRQKEAEIADMRSELSLAKQQLQQNAENTIIELKKALNDRQILTEKLTQLQASYTAKEKELAEANNKISDLEIKHEKALDTEWGSRSAWGSQPGWGTNKSNNKSIDLKGEKEW